MNTLFLAVAVATLAVAQTSGPKAPWQRARGQGGPPRTREEQDRLLAENARQSALQCELINGGQSAERRGDDAAAESLYVQACSAFGEDDPFAHDDLARLYDRQGQDREAFAEYGIALRGREGSWSSIQERTCPRYAPVRSINSSLFPQGSSA